MNCSPEPRCGVTAERKKQTLHKIAERTAQPNHDPNTHHCLCGADADLIMLGLATHEPNFTIIREEFKPNKPRPCALCNQVGHELKECQGVAREKQGEHDEFAGSMPGSEQEFIFIRLCVLREYLARELTMASLPFPFDFERSIDDWVFMCFFVGNDFLPHLPSLEIREGAIDRLVTIYKDVVHKTGVSVITCLYL
ncbi:5'-3' exoribonuclease 2-like [Notothenia coriiceps]|uniref:5'-3' exoribonuclease 2-like n=1 Tax=Notothenia coriiceps TaxID=8208 RepID=A0A6I9NJK7_9TELE|nr:PREDICTED: 5'-3' exoribonuclease 2-like [Notothenia coriiceps]